ncbi:MAG: class II glutamine amidotransferase, partial [Deltaproteobacteria bacterium]|nr:class II glutamine amidotransferase [Deltaproteobacteria bacterium]
KTMKEDVVTIIASNPLTRDEKWGKLKQQTGILFCKGEIMQRYA